MQIWCYGHYGQSVEYTCKGCASEAACRSYTQSRVQKMDKRDKDKYNRRKDDNQNN